MHRLLAALGSGLALLAAPALAADPVVTVGHNRIDPAELMVAVGSTVVFRNEDQMPGGHTVVAADGSFQSPALAKGQEWSHTFEKAGSYEYAIEQHPSARGRIVVE